MSNSNINNEKVSYLLKLLGRKRSAIGSNEDSDSEFEDLVEIITKHSIVDSSKDTSTLNMMLNPNLIVEDTYESETTESQRETESKILSIYEHLLDKRDSIKKESFQLARHLKYIQASLEVPLPHYFSALDANHGWLLYWLINAYKVISNELMSSRIKSLITDKISRNTVDNGLRGIAGGSNQIGHAAATYASILALVAIEDYETLSNIRFNLYKWLLSLKQANGSFIMHENGESDTRSTYCVLVIASLLNVLTDELTENTLGWINRCQTYEGGFSGIPDTEAHGGYTFCAVASYFLLLGKSTNFRDELNKNIDVENLLRWLAMRQYQLEGGLSGRTNKLVDACYSFWVGALFPMLESITNTTSFFNRDSLKSYILYCAQNEQGGFKDKPGRQTDFYHTDYALCGLSVCEYYLTLNEKENDNLDAYAYSFKSRAVDEKDLNTNPINPVFSLPLGLSEKCKKFFVDLDK